MLEKVACSRYLLKQLLSQPRLRRCGLITRTYISSTEKPSSALIQIKSYRTVWSNYRPADRMWPADTIFRTRDLLSIDLVMYVRVRYSR